MPDFRVFHVPTSPAPVTLLLDRDESHHLIVVNRARAGQPVTAFDGRGTEWLCELSNDSKNAAVLSVKSTRTAPPLPHEITLVQALPKGTGMDDIVRKATEIGAARIVPLLSERTQVHLDGDRQDKKTDKWRTAALEAAKQCGNPWLPAIAPVTPLAAFLTSLRTASPSPDLLLVASLHPGALPLKKIFADTAASLGRAPRHVTWLVGPEGDFSSAEIEQALTAGFRPATLGSLVLRCETAATFALAVTAHELMGG